MDKFEVIVIDVDLIKSQQLEYDEFLKNELDFDGTFETVEEYKNFMISIGNAYPEGVPFIYLYEKINSYRFEKIMNSLKSKGLIEETWNGDEPAYKVTELAKDILDNQ